MEAHLIFMNLKASYCSNINTTESCLQIQGNSSQNLNHIFFFFAKIEKSHLKIHREFQGTPNKTILEKEQC